MNGSERIDPDHGSIRTILRLVGPILLAFGAIFMLVGFVDFFSKFGSFSAGPPTKFWCFFVGMPLIFLGIVLTSAGFMGAVARYQAGEVAPVAKDTFNYIATESTEGVKAITRSISRGIVEGAAGTGSSLGVRCTKCGAENETDANFCDKCGAPLSKSKRCSSCGEQNDLDARFCDHCGANL